MATASVVQAQFRFPLPSPPRILFGGFRPLFSRPRPRPRPRPPVLVPANQFLQQQQRFRLCLGRNGRLHRCHRFRTENQIVPPPPPPPQQVFRPQPQPLPQPQSSIVFAPPPVSRPTPPPPPPPAPPAPPAPQFIPPSPPSNSVQFRPPPPPPSPSPINDGRNFGSPKPDSLLLQPPPQTFRPSQPATQPQTVQAFPAPISGPNSNNIIGMTPPPPPAPQALPAPPAPAAPRPTPARPPPAPIAPPPTTPQPVTARPVIPIAPVSNSLDNLLVNPVPSVNAGVLPLANEQPSEDQKFPPFV